MIVLPSPMSAPFTIHRDSHNLERKSSIASRWNENKWKGSPVCKLYSRTIPSSASQ